jgi:hypothetical protein
MQVPEKKEEEIPLPEEAKTKSVEIQTMFRESEAQTNPYAPEITTESKLRKPEVLMLEKLNYGISSELIYRRWITCDNG